jgi:F-type H+-transporting ATPase subunit alpha
MEAFAQFGSDLDKATLAQLERGRRLVQVLKQPQYKPLSVEQQVLLIFAGTNGYLDEYPEAAIAKYESELYQFIESRHPEVLAEIKEKKKISDEFADQLSKVLEEFKSTFIVE